MDFWEGFSRLFDRDFRRTGFVTFVLLTLALPCAVQAQLTHVDSVLASSLAPMVPSVNGSTAFLTGDSSYARLFAAMQKPPSTSVPMFYVAQLSANVQRADSGKARMDISMQGELLQPMNSVAVNRTLARTVNLDLTQSDWNGLENNIDRYVHYGSPPSGFWSDTAEKVLVVVGALAVVALFFLIRS
jgi:hypothetical protein